MIRDWAMGQKLYHEPERQDTEIEIHRLLENADQEALAIITNQREKAQVLAKALLVRETLTRAEALELFKNHAPQNGPGAFAV